MQSGKLHYLEGLRGVAAMQVALMHFVPPSCPSLRGTRLAAIARPIRWPHRRLCVLPDQRNGADTFLRPCRRLSEQIAETHCSAGHSGCRRGGRSQLLCWHCCPRRICVPRAITGSAWLAMDSSGAPTLSHLAREIGLDSLLLGYREVTLFAPLCADSAAHGAVTRRAVLVVASGTVWLIAGALPGVAACPLDQPAPRRLVAAA